VPPVSSLDSVGDKRLPPAIIALAQGRLSLAPHSVIILPDKSIFLIIIYNKKEHISLTSIVISDIIHLSQHYYPHYV